MICLEPIPVPHTRRCNNMVRKEVAEPIKFTDDIPICAGKEVYMTEHLDTRITLLEERGGGG